MKHLLFICLLLGLSALALSQTGKVTGTVMDSASMTPLELATITILNTDSSVIAYKLSDGEGNFTIDKLPLRKKLLVNITYTGYNGFYTSVLLNAGKTDTLNAFLTINMQDSGVVVTAAIPFQMNGDTLEINPAAFKMKEDAVVEELLNQISGITIWSDGTITVNGRQVNNLFVDGKPFMGSKDARIATQNLPKSAIEKIQLYQEYDRSKIGQQNQPQDSLLTMNIKLKETSKKGYFGKAGAGYGTSDRFESDLSFQVYTKKSSFGIGGGLNNINKNIGNLEDMFQNNTYRNYNPNLYNVGKFGARGINRNHSIGGVFVHNFIESSNSRQNDRLTINYNKSGNNSYITEQGFETRTTANNPQFIRDESVQNNKDDQHTIAVNYIKTNSYNDNLNLNAAAGTSKDKSNLFQASEVRDSANDLQSTNVITSRSNGKTDNQNLEFNFSKSNAELPAKSYNLTINASRDNSTSERDVASVFQSVTDPGQNASNNRHYSTSNENMRLTGYLDYPGFKRMLLGRYNLFGINLSFNQWLSYERQADNSHVNDLDPSSGQYVTNTDLTNRNRREKIEVAPSLQLSKAFWKYTEAYYRSVFVNFKVIEEFKTEKNASSFAKRNLDRSFDFFRYEGNVSYQYQKRGKVRYNVFLNYAKRFEYPTIDRLYTLVDDINAYEIRIGNPWLNNTANHNANLYVNFNTENPKSVYTFGSNINGGYTLMIDPVTDSIINDLSGKRMYYYINADRANRMFTNYSVNVSRRLKKNSIQFRYNGQFTTSKMPNYVDGFSNISRTGNWSHQFSLQFSLRSILIINLQENLQRFTNRTTASQLTSFKNRNNTTKLGIVLNWPANFTLSSTLDRIGNSNVDEPIYLWNTFATYRFMKQQAEFKLSAMDLLKQYQNISNYASTLGTTTRITNGLQQYFLLTFSYYPRKFGKTEIKRQEHTQAW